MVSRVFGTTLPNKGTDEANV